MIWPYTATDSKRLSICDQIVNYNATYQQYWQSCELSLYVVVKIDPLSPYVCIFFKAFWSHCRIYSLFDSGTISMTVEGVILL